MTTAPAVDVREHYQLIQGLLDTALAPHRPYRYGQVPGETGHEAGAPQDLPDMYALVDIQRRSVAPRRAGRAGRSGWVVSVRGVGRTSNEAAWVLNRATGALEEQVLTVAGRQSTPLLHDTTQPIRPDDGLHSGLLAWTYAL